MINLHLNGDVVRCPDVAAIKKRLAEIAEKEHRCKYGISEYHCSRWRSFVGELTDVKRFSQYGRCSLSGSILCPHYKQRVENGNKEKNFKIDAVNYRKLSSAAHYLVKKSEYKTLFITLTFPKFKKPYNEKQLNECFSKYVENLRTNYDCSGYVAVRERSKIHSRRYHFHLLISLPFVPFAVLNAGWIAAIRDLCHFSKNAVTSDKKTLFIRNPQRALRYVCKYFAKSKGATSRTRIIFISNNLVRKPAHFDNENCEYYTINDLLNSFKSVTSRRTSDYSTAFRINDNKEFAVFCDRILYKFFNLPRENIELYSHLPEFAQTFP